MQLLKLRWAPYLSRCYPCAVLTRPTSHITITGRRLFSGAHIAYARLKKVNPAARGQQDINYYEQDINSSVSRRQISQSDFGPSAEDLSELEWNVEKNIEQLQQETAQDDEQLEKDLENLGKEFTELFTEEQRLELVRLIERGGASDLAAFPHRVPSDQNLSKAANIFLEKFNKALDSASLQPENESVRTTLWRWYQRAKIYVPDLIHKLPDAAWKLLWTTQSEFSLTNRLRAQHLRALADDKIEAGKSLTKEQRHAHIEGLFLEGNQDQALAQTEQGLERGEGTDPDFLEIAIRLNAYTGNAQRAKDLFDILYKLHASWDARIIQVLIPMCLEQKTQRGREEAWALYLRLRQRLGSDMTIDDFDAVSNEFLHFEQKNLALAVFRDMFVSTSPLAESTQMQEKLREYFSLEDDAREINSMGLAILTHLPRKFHNKFFYASWMKRLIGAGNNNAAAMVVELMYERGVRPDAKHLNGLVGAWLRDSDSDSHEKGVALANSMLRSRLDFVEARLTKALNNDFLAPSKERTKPVHQTRPVPRATMETISLLVHHYYRQDDFGSIYKLRELLEAAELPMDAFFMNHLLYVELKQKDYRAVWPLFQELSRTVMPDQESWECLWNCMRYRVDINTRNTDRFGFPDPRMLFSHMKKWLDKIRSMTDRSHERDAFEDMKPSFFNKVIRCFLALNDARASFVVMHTLHSYFPDQCTPDSDTFQIVVQEIARSSLRPRSKEARLRADRRRRRKAEVGHELHAQVKETQTALKAIEQDRLDHMRSAGLISRLEDPQTGLKKEEQHRALLQLLYTVIKQRDEAKDGFNAELDSVALEMGIEASDWVGALALTV